MTLLLDRRTQLGDTPGFHALIVGVNAYPYLKGGTTPQPKTFGMQQLTSAVPSALRLYEWLLAHQDTLKRPLATCRVLLSPSPSEIGPVAGATLDNFHKALREWRVDASTHEEGGSMFYFAGHGIHRGGSEAVLLLEGFNDPDGGILKHAAATSEIFEGMSPMQDERAAIARTQLYFVDVCQTELENSQGIRNFITTPVWDLRSAGGRDDRKAPFYYAAIPGTEASAQLNQPTYFNRALLSSLDRAAAEPERDANGVTRWPVTVHVLTKMLTQEMEAILRELGGNQQCLAGGIQADTELHFLDRAPVVPVDVRVEPAAAAPSTSLHIMGVDETPVLQIPAPLDPDFFEVRLPMGLYEVWSESRSTTTAQITRKRHFLKAQYRSPVQTFVVM